MPLPILSNALWKGVHTIPYAYTILKVSFWLVVVAGLKYYFGGARNTAEKNMHGKVVMITGGTSGIASSLATSLAARGAQLILLTRHPPSDPFLADYITDLRSTTSNPMIYAEQVDLADLHSVRRFATKWIDNAPPRRLDAVVLCAATTGGKRKQGPEEVWRVNYLANFHLLGLLSPALRAQPPDRDVRVVLATCGSYMGGDLEGILSATTATPNTSTTPTAPAIATTPLPSPSTAYASSKLALTLFAPALQAHLTHSPRPDGQPSRARVLLVDPGLCRTPGTRRWLSGGSLWGLGAYLATWGAWWLVLKSREMGAESFLGAVLGDGEVLGGEIGDGKVGARGKGAGGGEGRVPVSIIKECRATRPLRPEVGDLDVAKRLWKVSEAQIEGLEREAAVMRALAKKEEAERMKESEKGNEKEDKEKTVDMGEQEQQGEQAEATTAAAAASSSTPKADKTGGVEKTMSQRKTRNRRGTGK